jgi:sporulation protein YlmC with PRC-barrel domain
MRASDVLGRTVLGADGNRLGKVLDIRVVQDGPLLGGFAALRIDGLVVGRRALAARLGYDRAHTVGPRVVAATARLVTADNRYLRWDDVEEIGDVIRARTSSLDRVPDLP